MANWKRHVVRVCKDNPYMGGTFAGSAFLISPLHLLTARHVLEDNKISDDNLVLQGPAWTETRKAKITHHPKRDISLLTLYEVTEDIASIPLDQPNLKDGLELGLKGYTALDKGLDSRPLPLQRYDGIHDRWALHTRVAHGNSGGPALLGDRLVGVIQARNDHEECSYIIPVQAFQEFLLQSNTLVQQLRPTERPEKPNHGSSNGLDLKNSPSNLNRYDVFLSHNSEDKSSVRDLKQRLTKSGISAWLDEEDLMPGEKWQAGLAVGMESSDSAAICFGPAGIGPWEEEEMEVLLVQAVKSKKRVIPVLLPGAPARPELPVFLVTRTWVDLRNGYTKENIDRLIWGIKGTKPNQGSKSKTATLPAPNHLAALVDKVPQWQAIQDQAQLNAPPKSRLRRAYAFVIAGGDNEWPYAIVMKLCRSVSQINPDQLAPIKPAYTNESFGSTLWQELAKHLGCDPDKKSVQDSLSNRPSAEVFWMKPPQGKHQDHGYLAELMKEWESLELGAGAPCNHFMLVVYDPKSSVSLLDRWLGRDPLDRWIKGMRENLKKHQLENRVLAKPTPPDVEQVKDWVDDHLNYLNDLKYNVRADVMELFEGRETIPHWELRKHLIKFLDAAHKP